MKHAREDDMLLQQASSKRSKKDHGHRQPTLPDEMLVEIFARLPAKSAGRCRCLSRSWAAALSSAAFVDLHLHQSNQQNQPPPLFFTASQRSLHAWRHQRHEQQLQKLTPERAVLPQLDEDCALRVLTPKPCHGLALLHRWPFHGHYVCNPSTGALVPLPDTKAPSWMCGRGHDTRPYTRDNTVSYGLGYDASAGAHKVVRLFSLRLHQQGQVITACEVFTVGGRYWRPAAHRPPPCSVRRFTPAVFFHGRLHFLQQDQGAEDGSTNEYSCRIVTFDVCRETFGALMPPAAGVAGDTLFELAVLDGCLCLHYAGPRLGRQQPGDYCIWRLTSPGSSYHDDVAAAAAGRWELLCSIRRHAWPEALLRPEWISPFEMFPGPCGRNRKRRIMFATSALTVFTVDSVDDHQPPEILLSAPTTGDAVVDGLVETDSCSHTVGLLEESLVSVGRPSEEILFSSPATKAWSDVLKWLPTRSVVPLRLVCRDWRAAISSDRFMHLHAAFHANNQQGQLLPPGRKKPLQVALIAAYLGLFWPLRGQEPAAARTGARELRHTDFSAFLFGGRSRVAVCPKPCHGLVVGSCTDPRGVSWDFICNPAMGYYEQSYQDPQADVSFLAGRIAVGYDPRASKHVRVRLVYRHRNLQTREYQLGCDLHLAETGSLWRPITPPPRPVAEMQPAYAHGKLYWLVDRNLTAGTESSSEPGCQMLALDVGTEEFEVLQGPPPACQYGRITAIVELQGNICVVCSDRGANAMDIWKLEGGVWSVGCRVELGESSGEYSPEETAPLDVDPTDGRLLLSTGRALGYYDPRTRSVETIHRLVGGHRGLKFAPVLCEESLICPYIRFAKATSAVAS